MTEEPTPMPPARSCVYDSTTGFAKWDDTDEEFYVDPAPRSFIGFAFYAATNNITIKFAGQEAGKL